MRTAMLVPRSPLLAPSFCSVLAVLALGSTAAARAAEPDWAALDAEALAHFQALVRIDTTDPPLAPPGGEAPAVEYLRRVLAQDGITALVLALEANRPNLVARLRGSGKRRPLLVLGHTDTVNVDPKNWVHPPFSAAQDGGFIYGRGTVDDKDNVVAALMTLLVLKRGGIALDRDVIFLAESGEEGSTRVGIQFMVNQHWDQVEAEFCLAEGGGVVRQDGKEIYASVQTLEKLPFAIELVARGVAGHGSVPLRTNSVVHLSKAVAAVADWRPPIRLNETTSAYFERLAAISPPEAAARYRAVLDPARVDEADLYFYEHEPRHASMLRSSLSPNIVSGGYRINVIPSESIATVDFRALPDEDIPAFLEQVRGVVGDPAVEVRLGQRATRPGTRDARLDSEVMKAIEAKTREHYGVATLPTMSTGATDMAYLRAKGMECYGIGPALDLEDGPKGFGAHSDQERILERELYRFVRFHYELVAELARAR